MNDSSPEQNLFLDEVSRLRQRLLELEQSNRQYQQQIEQLTQQLAQEKAVREQAEDRLQLIRLSVDVTECQQTEVALRESEERLRIANERFQLAAKAVNCLIYDWYVERDWVERTDGLTRLLGYSLDEAEPTGNWWRDRIHPDDLQPIIDRASVALPQGDYFTSEYRVLSKSNQYIDVLDQCLVVARDANGNPTRIVGSTTDISDRKRIEHECKQAELQLQESQRFIQQVADAMPGTLYVYDLLEQRNVYVNRQIGELLGYSPEQIQAFGDQMFAQLMHPDDFAAIGMQLARLHRAQDGEVIDYEYRMRHVSGKWCWLWSRNTVSTRTPEGLAHQVVGTVHDITDRKQAEADLAESNQTLQAIIQACPLAIIGLRADGTVRIWNPAAEQIFGWSQQEVLGQFLPAIPDDKRDEFLNNLAITLEGQGLVGIEARRQKKGSIVVDVELWTAPVDETQAGISCLAVMADISDRKQAEAALQESKERFQALADNIAQLAWMANGLGWVFWYNQRWFDYTGTTAEEMQGWGWQTVHHPDHVERVVEKFCRHMESGEIWEDTFPLRSQDGSYRWFLSRAVPIRDEQGRVLRWFGTNTDITDRQQAEAEREQLLMREQAAREQAEAANRVKDEFLAVLSHELRTPLNPILGWTKLLRTRPFDSQATDRALETIERNARLQAQLIEDLLDVSRILQGKVGLNTCPVNLVTTIEAALETVRLSAEAKSIDLRFTMLDVGLGNQTQAPESTTTDASNPPKFKIQNSKFQVLGDSNRLQQVVWNLLSNAVKFTPTGGQIEVTLKRFECLSLNDELEDPNPHPSTFNPQPLQNYAQIQVTDTGQGISPDFLPHVFEYFRQADATTTRHFGGLGLGLAIARYLIELHGGTVQAESPGLGKGATFTVYLPLLVPVSTSAPEEASAQKNRNLSGIRILIVDDEADMRELIRFILEEQGATVVMAASAAEALQQIAVAVPDVLISDIGMPETDGYTLIRQIRTELWQQGMMPAIALTAYAGDINQQKALAAGFQLHLAKPIEPDQLLKSVTQVMTQSFQPSS